MKARTDKVRRRQPERSREGKEDGSRALEPLCLTRHPGSEEKGRREYRYTNISLRYTGVYSRSHPHHTKPPQLTHSSHFAPSLPLRLPTRVTRRGFFSDERKRERRLRLTSGVRACIQCLCVSRSLFHSHFPADWHERSKIRHAIPSGSCS